MTTVKQSKLKRSKGQQLPAAQADGDLCLIKYKSQQEVFTVSDFIHTYFRKQSKSSCLKITSMNYPS